MRRIVALTIASLTVVVFGLGLIASTYAQVAGKTFFVHIVTSTGELLGTCLRFDAPSRGLLRIDGLGDFKYTLGQLNEVPTSFKAVSSPEGDLARIPRVTIMLYGQVINAFQEITGEGLVRSTFGLDSQTEQVASFVFTGSRQTPCVPELPQ